MLGRGWRAGEGALALISADGVPTSPGTPTEGLGGACRPGRGAGWRRALAWPVCWGSQLSPGGAKLGGRGWEATSGQCWGCTGPLLPKLLLGQVIRDETLNTLAPGGSWGKTCQTGPHGAVLSLELPAGPRGHTQRLSPHPSVRRLSPTSPPVPDSQRRRWGPR